MKNRFPFICGICLRPSHSCRNEDREVPEYLQKQLTQEDFLFFWNLPRNDGIPGIEERDRLSQGKYALPHALLRTEEIEDELLFSNEKSSEHFLEPVFPPCPAPFRTSLRRIYQERGRIFLENGDRIHYIDSGRTVSFPLMRIDGNEAYPSLRRRMKKLRRLGQMEETPVFIILDTSTRSAAEEAVSHLLGLRKKFRFEALELKELLKAADKGKSDADPPENSIPFHFPAISLPSDPGNRFRREIAWDKPKETRILLLSRALEPENEESRRDCGTLPVPERGMIAHMPGEVEMEEGDIAAYFSHGELAGLSKSGTAELLRSPSSAWIETGEDYIRSRSIGSFSFQNSAIRGLRDSCIFESGDFSEPGRLVRDYFFAVGETRLCISYFLFFPRCKPGVRIRSYGVGEIPIFPADGLPQAEVHYPGEELSEISMDGTGGGVLHGSAFSFKGRSTRLSLVFADHQAKIRELPFRVSNGALRINPGGSYQGFPGKKIEDLRERFSIVLSLDSISPKSPPPGSLASLLPHLESHQMCREARHNRKNSG